MMSRYQNMRPIAKLMASGYGLVSAIAAVSAASWSDIRAPALALCIAAAAQLPVWTGAPMVRPGKPSIALAALEVAIGVGSVVASLVASVWFILPAVVALSTAAGLVWARRIGPIGPPREVASAVPPELSASRRKSMEELRAVLPGLHRVFVAAIAFFLILALLCAVAATAAPLMLVMAALFAGLAGSVRIGAWAWVKTTSPSLRRELEQRRRERDVGRQAGNRNG